MLQLLPNECRVLGTLIEKAQTTPGQYPLTLNSLTSGCNQKNNREPVTEISEDQVLTAVDGLKSKNLVREVMLSGSRVNKFKHVTREVLNISVTEMAILAELLLRGPQSVGELRGRAERLVPPGSGGSLASIEEAQRAVNSLLERPEPMVQRLAHRSGERAVRFAQLLCPDLHPLDASPPDIAGPSSSANVRSPEPGLSQRMGALERLVRELSDRLDRLES